MKMNNYLVEWVYNTRGFIEGYEPAQAEKIVDRMSVGMSEGEPEEAVILVLDFLAEQARDNGYNAEVTGHSIITYDEDGEVYDGITILRVLDADTREVVLEY